MNLTQYLAVNLKFVLNKKAVWAINNSQLLFILEIWDRAHHVWKKSHFAEVKSVTILALDDFINKARGALFCSVKGASCTTWERFLKESCPCFADCALHSQKREMTVTCCRRSTLLLSTSLNPNCSVCVCWSPSFWRRHVFMSSLDQSREIIWGKKMQ